MQGRIGALRKALGMTQAAFGEKLGISDVSISRIEGGKNALTEQNIKLICLIFKVNEEWLRTGKGDMFGNRSMEDEAMELLMNFQELTPLSRKMILDHIKHIYMLEHGHTHEEAYKEINGNPAADILEIIDKKHDKPQSEPEPIEEKGTGTEG
jgi:transcriptional regulator with XRE-family HTH domain